jgi:23S rRNA pseudouridine1911/1915/1917 synthase
VNAGLFHVLVDETQSGQRLDRALAAAAEAAGVALSRTRLQALIAEGHVTVDGRTAEAKSKITAGSRIAVTLPLPVPAEPQGQAIPLAVVFEDAHLLVLDKPAGLVVHPAAGHDDGTLVNALIAHCGDSLSGIGGVRRPGIVHRLDKDTSGLMVVAKTDAAHSGLSEIFADHGRSGSLVREYLAFVWGVPERANGTVSAALARDPHNRLKMAVVAPSQGRHAVTHWTRVEAYGAAAALVSCSLETGCTHLIRVHMAGIGHALIGDPVYGKALRTKAARLPEPARTAALGLERQALHAASLGFAHPVTREELLFASALPPDLEALRTSLLMGPAAIPAELNWLT